MAVGCGLFPNGAIGSSLHSLLMPRRHPHLPAAPGPSRQNRPIPCLGALLAPALRLIICIASQTGRPQSHLDQQKRPPAKQGAITNGAKRIRTADPLHAMQVLYQLSYGPIDAVGFPIAAPTYMLTVLRAGARRPRAAPGSAPGRRQAARADRPDWRPPGAPCAPGDGSA